MPQPSSWRGTSMRAAPPSSPGTPTTCTPCSAAQILDSRTCNYCLSVDGRVIERDDPFGRNTIFHSSCRGIWVSILMDEEDKPSIGGIPQSLKDRFGDAVDDLIQPRTPQNTKNSL